MSRFVINRSRRSPAFGERELAVLEVIQPHLANYFDIYALLASAEPSSPTAGDVVSAYPCLTRREAEIAALLCHGCSTGMIGSQLFISRLTVYKHIEHALEKLGVTSRAELTARILGKDGLG